MSELELMLCIALPFIMAVLNRWRGSRMDQLIGSNLWFIKNGAPIAAVGIMLIVFGFTENIVIGFMAGLAYFGGETFGWAKWVRSAQYWWTDWQDEYNKQWLDRKTGKSSGIHQIANAVFKETKNFTNYAILALILRGIWWWTPVYAVLFFFGVMPWQICVAAVLAMGIFFPICYYVGGQLHNNNIGKENILLGIYMNNAEKFYGFAQGLVLAASFFASHKFNHYVSLIDYYY